MKSTFQKKVLTLFRQWLPEKLEKKTHDKAIGSSPTSELTPKSVLDVGEGRAILEPGGDQKIQSDSEAVPICAPTNSGSAATQEPLLGFDYSKLEGLLFAYLFLMERSIQKNGSTLHEKEVFDEISQKLSQPIVEDPHVSGGKRSVPRRVLLSVIASMNRFDPTIIDDREKNEILTFLSQLNINERYIVDVKRAVKSQNMHHYLQIMQKISPKSQMGRYVQITVRFDTDEQSIKRAIDGLQGLLLEPMDQIMNYDSRVQENSSLIIKSGSVPGWSTVPIIECPKLDTVAGVSSLCLYCSYVPLSSSGYLPSVLIIALNYVQAVLSAKLLACEHADANFSSTNNSQTVYHVANPNLLKQDKTSTQSKINHLNLTRNSEHNYLIPTQVPAPKPDKVINTFQVDEKETLWDLLGSQDDSEKITQQKVDFSSDIHLFSDVEGWLLCIEENPP